MSKWLIKFQVPEGCDEWVMDYPFEPDEETMFEEIIEGKGEYGSDEISLISVTKIK